MPDRNLKIALIPIDIQLGKTEENLITAKKLTDRVDSDTDLIVLPEMFNTGFTSDVKLLKSIAEPNDGHTISTLRTWASEKQTAIWGGFTAVDNGRYYNRGFMIDDKGNVVFYNKRHLFRYGGESRILTAGNEKSPVINYKSWNLKMSICYDLRFPVWNRAVANNYDVLIVPANWAHARVFAWKHLLIARAIENQAFVLGCNREGSDVYGHYPAGDSFAFNNWGDDIADTRADGTIYATLDADTFRADRERFAPWRDADKFDLLID
mgnify:CR=1 FL=1